MNPTLLIATALLAAEPTHRLAVTGEREIEATLHFTVNAPSLKATQWWVQMPQAPELPGQVKVTTTLEPAGRTEADLSPARRPLVVVKTPARTPAQARQMKVAVKYRAKLLARELHPVDPDKPLAAVAPLPAAVRQHCLATSKSLDFKDERFQKWLDDHGLRRLPGVTDLALAQHAFNAVTRQLRYEYKPDQDRRASAVCEAETGDCGAMTFLFVSALRANGIPARALVGRWAQSAKPGEQIGGTPNLQQHVRAEFFVPSIGWIPVDPAHRKFGSDDGNFLTFHVDPDIEVTSPNGRHTAMTAQSVIYWALGGGSLDGVTLEQEWQVRALTPSAAPVKSPK